MRSLNRIMIVICALALLLLVDISPAGTPLAAAQGGFAHAIFDIVPDSSGLNVLPPAGGTFFITGKIYPFKTVNQADCSGITTSTPSLGVWRAWGEGADGGRIVVHQSYQLDAFNGVIELQGPSGLFHANGDATRASSTTTDAFTGPTEVLSVVGGVGTYRSVSGEAQIRPYCQSQSDTGRPFRYDRAFCFSLAETPRRNR